MLESFQTRGDIYEALFLWWLLRTMLSLWSQRRLRPALGALKYAESLHVESADAPHEGFLHRFLVTFSLQSQPLNLCLGLRYNLTVLQRRASEHRRMWGEAQLLISCSVLFIIPSPLQYVVSVKELLFTQILYCFLFYLKKIMMWLEK